MLDAEIPSLLARPPSEGFTSTVSPAGVSAEEVSGAAVMIDPKARFSQPANPVGLPLPSWVRKDPSTQVPGAVQLFTLIENGWAPAQDVGNVRNGLRSRWAPSEVQLRSPFSMFSLLHPPICALRHGSCEGSAGTPHSVS